VKSTVETVMKSTTEAAPEASAARSETGPASVKRASSAESASTTTNRASAVEPASTAVEPASTAVEPASTAVEPASSTVEPASSTVEPASSTVATTLRKSRLRPTEDRTRGDCGKNYEKRFLHFSPSDPVTRDCRHGNQTSYRTFATQAVQYQQHLTPSTALESSFYVFISPTTPLGRSRPAANALVSNPSQLSQAAAFLIMRCQCPAPLPRVSLHISPPHDVSLIEWRSK
jgi:hypothetical protein